VAIKDVFGGRPHSSPRGNAENDPTMKMCGGHVKATHGYIANKDSYAKRLRRIEGQIRGIAKMIDDDQYCIDILTQISAASSALRSVALNLLDDHLDHCVTQALAEGEDKADVKLAEASAAIARLVRS
jgi:CsoR family transcriptional regulator, copper-sensing transcriptional repressor